MAVQACADCNHFYIVPDQQQAGQRCPRCGQALQPVDRDELRAHLQNSHRSVSQQVDTSGSMTPSTAAAPAEPAPPEVRGVATVHWAGAEADSALLMQRACVAHSQMRGCRTQVAARLAESRLLRRQLTALVHELRFAVDSPPPPNNDGAPG
jgi:hypothetical protein